ncbi:nuclear transport factor 2 family protein [Methylobacterium sp. J-001]|uniref:nuclear transport factor 2 family protein n=1 Tax=Methylobacterium sp. J-001 TaxID=2836609 RepID=UPI001FBB31B6|nr:nuclear transport factor 2 family protein [Methylobacterium sp. J-001]MCJ2120906.1 nuclear transport factor 2 family protein [Methylobacterium sp. J-001]
MTISRRSALAAAFAIAAAAPILIHAGPAIAAKPGDSAQGTDVEAAVDNLTKALLAADGTALDALTLDGLSYGHSSGVVQDKAAFIEALTSGRSRFPSITLSDRSASVIGDDAIVRHVFTGETISGGNTAPVHIGVLQVWRRDGARWRLMARQAFKL